MAQRRITLWPTGGWRILRRRALPAGAVLLLIAALLMARIWLPDPFERLRLVAFDTLTRAAPRRYDPALPVRVVDIDDASLARYGQWPWSRALIATVIRRLQDLGAASIALDVVFAEPDRTSPAALAAAWAQHDHLALPAAGALPDYDDDLARVLARGRVVTGFGLLAAANGRQPAIKAGFALLGTDPLAQVPQFQGAVVDLAKLEQAAAGNGSFSILGGRDQSVRRLPLVLGFAAQPVPSLALEALRVALGQDTIALRGDRGSLTLRLGGSVIPLAADGGLWLHPTPPEPRRMLPVWRLLDAAQQATVAPEIAGHIVLIGASAVGLVDLRQTALNAFEPGVNIHAGALEQILSGDFLRRPAWADGAEILLAVALAAMVSLLAAFAGQRAAGLVAGVGAGLVLAAAWFGFRHGLLLDPSFSLLAVLAAWMLASLLRYLLAERDGRKLRTAFAHYLSPALVAELARDPERLRLGGELREMSFLFTDLEGFTRLTESFGAPALVGLLNAYLDGLCDIAFAAGGTLDKIVGDAVHVMFNAPLDQPDHAARAVRCALRMDEFGQAFAAARRAEGIGFGVTRIGVNTGPAVVGNFGGARRFDYTAHGDAINTAARLEAANKALGTRICVSASARAGAMEIVCRPIGALLLRGKSQPIEVFEPLATPPAWLDAYAAAFDGLRRGEPAALLRLHAAHPEDPVLALHAGRIARGETPALITA